MVVALTRTVGKHYKARPRNLWELDELWMNYGNIPMGM